MENLKLKRSLIIQEAKNLYDLAKRKKKKIDWNNIFMISLISVETFHPQLKNVKVKFTEKSLKKYVYSLKKIKSSEKNKNRQAQHLKYGNLFNQNEKLLKAVNPVKRIYRDEEEIIFKNYINKNLYYSIGREKVIEILEQLDLIIRTIINLLPPSKSKYSIRIINWPQDLYLNFSWKEFLKSYRTVNENKFLSIEKKISIQKIFFSFLKFKKVFSKKKNCCYNLQDLLCYNWEISFNININTNIETGRELLDGTTKISLYCSPINEMKPWFKYTLLFEKRIIKEKIRNLNLRKLKSPITKIVQGISNLLFEIQINTFGKNKFTYELMQISLEDLSILLGHYNTFGFSKLSLLKKYIEEINDIFLKLNFAYILLPSSLTKNSLIFIEPNSQLVNMPLLKNLESSFITKKSKLFALKNNFNIPEQVIYEKLKESIRKNKGIVSKFIISQTFFKEMKNF